MPELFGAAHLFAARAVDQTAVGQIYAMLEAYRAYALPGPDTA